jgi:MarR family 2-MHQ and catechol resistance regulon transcriptional repressor
MSQPQGPWTPIAQEVSLLPVLRQLAESQIQVDRTLTRFLDRHGLTLPQFDVIVTLGDMSGMTCKQLGEQSLTTKGSLLPLLDRLESKGWIRRAKGEQDCRQTLVILTPEGQALYERVFAAFLAENRPRLGTLADHEQTELLRLLQKVKAAYAEAGRS